MIKKLLTLSILITMFSCSTMKIAVKEDFWQKKDVKIGVALSTYKKGGAYREGSEGLLDMVINNVASKGVDKFLQDFKPEGFKTVREVFSKKLTEQGYNIKLIDTLIDLNKLPSAKTSGKAKFKKDLSSVAKKEDIDILILVSIDRFGTLRSYWGFIPLGSPQALFQVTGQMIDLNTNSLLWYTEMEEKGSLSTVIGPWDQEPDFPNLAKALNSAMSNAKTVLEYEFYKKNK